MIPDTFFFVSIKVDNKEYSYGPYLNLNDAIEILVDIAPSMGAMLAKRNNYSYQALIEEKIIDENCQEGIWKTISAPLSEEKAYIKKTPF